ncbi:hypothetical protein E2562_023487 [Oryza meyeriana var. granulata]|uniref:Uncharacterized protein n=1 Tax=Oryza meyeriana var. granulata TaxID=110450 RepID=A0A6G1C030_9ORYZ|nr:hypothetical protein E2562_023487 [Oryza meyeriana var. granulata]
MENSQTTMEYYLAKHTPPLPPLELVDETESAPSRRGAHGCGHSRGRGRGGRHGRRVCGGEINF